MEKIYQDQKMIAQFMGYVETRPNYFIVPYGETNVSSIVGLKFNTSWNWLMPVVDKIEIGLSNDQQEFRVVIFEDEVNITQKYRNGVLLKDFEVIVQVDADGSTKKAATYEAVVQFINWYNKQK